MYIVTIQNDDTLIEIHGASEKLKTGNVVKGINTIDSFSFSMLPSNIGFNSIRDYKTLVKVYNTNKKRVEFYGRVLYSNTVMEESGLIYKEIICESYFGFLCDSKQKYVAEKNWTVTGLLEHIIDVHNSQVEDYKRFTIGDVTATDANDNLYIGIQRENSWKTIAEKLINKLGGEIRFRVENGYVFIDYLEEIGEVKETTIALSKNMKAITRECDPSNLISRLIPLGCKLTDSEGNETEERLDITSVNDGVEYIEDEDAKNAYGIRVECVEFDDVTEASNLLSKGKSYLEANNRVQIKYSIKALDLSLLGLDIDDFEEHNYHPIENALLGINDTARIIKKNIDVCNDTESTIEVGDNFKTISDIQAEQAHQHQDAVRQIQVITSSINALAAKTGKSYGAITQWCHENDLAWIDGASIYAGTIETVQIATGAVTADKILSETITGDKIAAETITGDKIAANAITAKQIDVASLFADTIYASEGFHMSVLGAEDSCIYSMDDKEFQFWVSTDVETTYEDDGETVAEVRSISSLLAGNGEGVLISVHDYTTNFQYAGPVQTTNASASFRMTEKGAEISGSLKVNDAEVLARTVLYEDSVGTTGEVALSESASNFKMLEIIAGYSDIDESQNMMVYEPNGKTFDISSVVPNAYGITAVRTRCAISGDSITQTYNAKTHIRSDTGFTHEEGAMYIKAVIGYR